MPSSSKSYWRLLVHDSLSWIGFVIFLVVCILMVAFDWRSASYSIGSAIVAGGVIAILLRADALAKRFSGSDRFERFFGKSIGRDRDVLVIIPYFSDIDGESENSESEAVTCSSLPEVSNEPTLWPKKAQKYIKSGLTSLAAFEDLRSAVLIGEMFATEVLYSPKIVPDKDWANVRESTSNVFTAVSIGLFSNSVNRIFYHATHRSTDNYCVSITPLEGSTSGGEIRIRISGHDVEEWLSVTNEPLAMPEKGRPVHAVIMRLVDSNSGSIAIVAGGLTEHGTKHAGQFVKDRWEELFERIAQDGEQVGDRSFAAVLQVEKESNPAREKSTLLKLYALPADAEINLTPQPD